MAGRFMMPFVINVSIYSKVITVVINSFLHSSEALASQLNSRPNIKPPIHKSTPSLAVLDKGAGHIDGLARRVDRIPR